MNKSDTNQQFATSVEKINETVANIIRTDDINPMVIVVALMAEATKVTQGTLISFTDMTDEQIFERWQEIQIGVTKDFMTTDHIALARKMLSAITSVVTSASSVAPTIN